jgi:acetylornithine deacetylase
VDPLNVVSLARTLVDIDSTSGGEAEIGQWLAAHLRALGYRVTEQTVAGDRINVIAVDEPPVVVLSTHMDCVPPFFASRVADGVLYGRGACDAKGILAAQVTAAERLRASGERRVGLLFVVGEERGSDGARVANTAAPGSRYLINGEPTGNRLGSATRGVLRVKIVARGRAAHSAHPELGDSAIDKLIDALSGLKSATWDEDPLLGRTHHHVGLISGGVAPNVIAPHAEAEVMFRTVADAANIRRTIARTVRDVDVEEEIEVPPVRLETVSGFDTATFAFTTDIPFLTAWGRPLLVGPGSILVAHTSEEHVALSELEAAVDIYARLATRLIQAPHDTPRS